MIDRKKPAARLAALALAALFMGYLGVHAAAAVADDAPSPPSSASGADAPPQGRHHNPAWAACKKQADDQKLAPGDARHEFMKSCMKAAKDAAPPASP